MKYRKKPVEVEAKRWVGFNWDDIAEWCPYGLTHIIGSDLTIDTLEGRMTVKEGDWIIKGVEGEFYPCKPDIFEKTYEKVKIVEGSNEVITADE